MCEPKQVGTVDTYLNLGMFINREGLLEKRRAITELTAANKACFVVAARWIRSARSMSDLAFEKVTDNGILSRISSRAKALCSREIPSVKRAQQAPVKRFLSSITPAGHIVRFDTVTESFSRVVALDDNFGLASYMLAPIVRHAAANGYKTYACYSPLHPDTKIEHVLIPELGLAFVTNSRALPYPEAASRHIRLDALIPKETLKNHRVHLRFLAKTQSACITEAVEQLKTAKLIHDKIEELYKPYVDFGAVNASTLEKTDYLRKIMA